MSGASARIGLLGLGSNIGDRREHLQAAVRALADVEGFTHVKGLADAEGLAGTRIEVLASSSVYDTDPVGEVLDQPSFLNACLRVRTSLEPLQLLDVVKGIERELGRPEPYERHSPRAIDIDVLLLGDVEFRHERMTLPHEQVLSRRFVLIPALELDLELATPDGRRLADALLRLSPAEGVRWAGPPLALR